MMMQNLLSYLHNYYGDFVNKNFTSDCVSNNIGVEWDSEKKCVISDVEKTYNLVTDTLALLAIVYILALLIRVGHDGSRRAMWALFQGNIFNATVLLEYLADGLFCDVIGQILYEEARRMIALQALLGLKCLTLEYIFATSSLNRLDSALWVLEDDQGLAERIKFVVQFQPTKLYLAKCRKNSIDVSRVHPIWDLRHVDYLV